MSFVLVNFLQPENLSEYVAKKLDLNIEPISTQIIPRDRHASFFSVLAIIASSIERLSTEIRKYFFMA